MIGRLAQAGFEFLPAFETNTHFALAREGFVFVLEKRRDGRPGNTTSMGVLDGSTLCALTWKRQGPVFAGRDTGKNKELPATTGQLEELRKLDSELREVLRSSLTR